MLNIQTLVMINLSLALALLGVILVIQIVHYPSFHFVPTDRFSEFSSFHSKRISLIVIPLMTLELVSSVWLFTLNWRGPLIIAALIMVLAIWLVTFLISVPLHQCLSKGKDLGTINHLIATNWLRTIAWATRCLLLTLLLEL